MWCYTFFFLIHLRKLFCALAQKWYLQNSWIIIFLSKLWTCFYAVFWHFIFVKKEAWQFEMHFFYVTFHFFFTLPKCLKTLEINYCFWLCLKIHLFLLMSPAFPGTCFCELSSCSKFWTCVGHLTQHSQRWLRFLGPSYHDIPPHRVLPLGVFFPILLELHLLSCVCPAVTILNSFFF